MRAELAIVAVIVVGCGDDGVALDDLGTGESLDETGLDDAEASSQGDDDDGPTSGSSVDETSAGSESTTGGEPAVCGDGERTGLEQCDDANDTPGDGCEPGCLLPSGETVWSVTVDGDGGMDRAHGVAVTATGEIVVVGSMTTGDATDLWVGRYSPAGDEISSVSLDYGEGLDDVGNDLALLDDGGIAIIGTREQASDPMLDDAIVVVLEPDGTERWATTIDGGMNDRGLDVAFGPGGLAIAGVREDPASEDDAWFAVYDPGGAELWSLTDSSAGGGDDAAEGIAWTGDGGLVVVGKREGQGDDDLWISGRDGDGAELWTELLDFDFGDDTAAAVAIDGDTAWVTGMISSAVSNSEELWVASYSVSGAAGFATTWNSTGFVVDAGAAIAIDGAELFVAGSTAAADEQRNIVVARFTARTPAPIWVHGFDGGAQLQDEGTSIAVLPDGSVVATGVVTVLGEGTNAWIRRFAG